MKKVNLVYDDTIKVPDNIQTIIGNTSYGKIILKRKQLFNRFEEIVNEVSDNVKTFKMDNIEEIINTFDKVSNDFIVLHIFSNYVVKNIKDFKILIEKLHFLNQNYKIVQDDKIIAIAFCNLESYKKFLNNYNNIVNNLKDSINYEIINTNAFLDISIYNDFLTYISGGFDARFFNSLEGNEFVITKKSNNKKKIKQEYMYYQLLPDDMKKWMIMPYDYKENEEFAQYTMERLHTTDIAIRWTHKAISEEEFINILKKSFYYITNRTCKNISKEEYETIEEKLYKKK